MRCGDRDVRHQFEVVAIEIRLSGTVGAVDHIVDYFVSNEFFFTNRWQKYKKMNEKHS